MDKLFWSFLGFYGEEKLAVSKPITHFYKIAYAGRMQNLLPHFHVFYGVEKTCSFRTDNTILLNRICWTCAKTPFVISMIFTVWKKLAVSKTITQFSKIAYAGYGQNPSWSFQVWKQN